MNETLIFGGSFDPVHNGHVAMLEAAITQLQPARTLVIPVGNAWQKARMPYAPSRHRIAMLKLALPNITVDDREVSRGGPTYSVDTVRELKLDYPTEKFVWLLGGDAFSKLDTWQEPVVFSQLVRFAVVLRASEEIIVPRTPVQHEIVDCSPPAISSTQIRALLQIGGKSRESVRALVPIAVYDYIQHHQLYL
jgi:nicotinate-nucleotide adenylyltransferase